MSLKGKIKKLANVHDPICVTISLNTHRTHPDSLKDEILLKNLVTEAEKRLIEEFGKRPAAKVLERLSTIEEKINRNESLDSMHIFLSDNTEEIIKTIWPTPQDRVIIGESFDLRALIKDYNRSTEYMIMVLSQGGVLLYNAVNECITKEIKNEDFPFAETPYYTANGEERSNAKLVDDLIREFYNEVDKSLIRVARENELKTIVIGTEDNFSKLLQVTDDASVYIGYAPIDYNNSKPHNVVEQAWEIIKEELHNERKDAIEDVKEAISQHKVLTDLQEIYQAAIDGRGDTLIVYEDFSQPVAMKDERTFERVNDIDKPNVIEDITSVIAWDILDKGGRVYFTHQEEIKDLGEIVLKTRY